MTNLEGMETPFLLFSLLQYMQMNIKQPLKVQYMSQKFIKTLFCFDFELDQQRDLK